MKKQKLKSLELSKKTISNLNTSDIRGGKKSNCTTSFVQASCATLIYCTSVTITICNDGNEAVID